MIKKILLVIIIFSSILCYAIEDDKESLFSQFKKLGKLKTKHSIDIEGSGLSIGYEALDRNAFEPKKIIRYLDRLGVKWARVQTGWALCEKEKGKYNFEWLDEIIDPLIEIGINPWFVVGSGNKVYMKNCTNDYSIGWQPLYNKEAKEGWLKFVNELAKHYKGRVNNFEIWDEPDNERYWFPGNPSAKEYTELVKITSAEIKKIIPGAVIIGGAFSYGLNPKSFQFIEFCFNEGLQNYINALSFHHFSQIPEEYTEEGVDRLNELIKRYNVKPELWMSESG
jgi:polysaccharide biosynthesis protein PslG